MGPAHLVIALWGEQRLQGPQGHVRLQNNHAKGCPQRILRSLRELIAEIWGGSRRSDDITQLRDGATSSLEGLSPIVSLQE